MDIAIIDKSEMTTLRLGSLISGIKGIKNIIQIIDTREIFVTLGKVMPQVIIYDMNMNGRENLSNLKKIQESFPKTVIIALTSYSTEQYQKKCNEIGIHYCLDKINEFEKIPDIISGIIR
jgi:DNA-binding NarL/FixJ family response regulator